MRLLNFDPIFIISEGSPLKIRGVMLYVYKLRIPFDVPFGNVTNQSYIKDSPDFNAHRVICWIGFRLSYFSIKWPI